MLGPCILPRIEQRDVLTTHRVEAMGSGPFVLIAQFTSQAKIVCGVCTTFGNGHYVVDLQLSQHVILMAQTVFAAIAGTLPDTLTHGFSKHGRSCR
jgi:hypothetical protein